jgi:hypothetical protein
MAQQVGELPVARCDRDFTVPTGISSFSEISAASGLEVLEADDRRLLGRKRVDRAGRARPRRAWRARAGGHHSPVVGGDIVECAGRPALRGGGCRSRRAIVASQGRSRSTSSRSAACHAHERLLGCVLGEIVRPSTRYATAYTSRPYSRYNAHGLGFAALEAELGGVHRVHTVRRAPRLAPVPDGGSPLPMGRRRGIHSG